MIRVYVREQLYGASLQLFVIRQYDDGGPRQILRMRDGYQRWEELPSGAAISAEPEEPSFEMPLDVGQDILQALVRHYQGAEDTRSLRRDYDAERKRVDQQAQTIADIARALANNQTQERI